MQGLDARGRDAAVWGGAGVVQDGELPTDLVLRYPDLPATLVRVGRPAAGRRGEQRCSVSAGIGQLSNSARTLRRQYRTP